MSRALVLMVAASLAAVPRAAADSASDELTAEIAALRHHLAEATEDVDARFALALRLSWAGDLDEAEAEAAAVLAAAPTYWDAHIISARLAGWRGDFARARDRLGAVLGPQPWHIEGLTLAVDLELWSGEPEAAKRRAAQLLTVDDSAASRFRAAQAAALAMETFETRRWARRTLEMEPGHRPATELLRATNVVRFAAVSDIEVFPIDENALAFGQLVSATAFPSSRWSGSVGYEYRLRFGTENHRARLGAARRVQRDRSVDFRLGVGKTHVIPELTVEVGARGRFADHYGGSLELLADKMPWPGQLYRARASGGVGLSGGFELGAAYEGGVLHYCDVTDPVQSLALTASFRRGIARAGLRYGFGMELDRAPLPPFLDDRFGDAVCDEVGLDISLRDTRAQHGSLEFGLERIGRFSLVAGYGLQVRFAGEIVHFASLGLNLWL